jgi:hypothetical protein
MVVGSEAIFPTIVTRGLKINLDGTNPASYSGSGTTWNDISGNGYNATLVNSPTFANGNTAVGLGSFEFNGSTQYAVTTAVTAWFDTGLPFTLELWAKNTNTAGSMLSWSVGTGNPGVSFLWNLMELGTVGPFYTARWMTRSSTLPQPKYGNMGTVTPPANEWQQYVMTFGGTLAVNTMIGYQGPSPTTTLGVPNAGTPYNTVNTSMSTPNLRLAFGGATSSGMTGASNFFAGRIGILRGYNRVLTQTEIQQNYNATRAYYGL